MKLFLSIVLALLGVTHASLSNFLRRKAFQIEPWVTCDSNTYFIHENEDVRENLIDDNCDGLIVSDLFVNDYEELGSSFDGDLSVRSNGDMRYDPDTDWSDSENRFRYEVCDRSFPPRCATTTAIIWVTEDPDKPDPPDVQFDSYRTVEGVELDVDEGDGLLWNDFGDNDEDIYVANLEEGDDFSGDLDWSSDGSFVYTPESGVSGETMRFRYEVCYGDWSDVRCRWARATIRVDENPDKPKTTPKNPSNRIPYTIRQGETLVVEAPGFMKGIQGDLGSTLYSYDTDRVQPFYGDYDTNSDGSFVYEPAAGWVGVEVFEYEVCYREWPDLCVFGNVTIETKATEPPTTEPATPAPTEPLLPAVPSGKVKTSGYHVKWDSSDDAIWGCEAVEPKFTMKCNGNGQLKLLDARGNTTCIPLEQQSLYECTVPPAMNGAVFAECQGNGLTDRQLLTTLSSGQFNCGLNNPAPPIWAFHSLQMRTWCQPFMYRNDACSGTVVTNVTDGSLQCRVDYFAVVPPEKMVALEDVSLNATGFDSCIYYRDVATNTVTKARQSTTPKDKVPPPSLEGEFNF